MDLTGESFAVLSGVGFFYMLILGVGLWAQRMGAGDKNQSTVAFLGGRNIPLWIGIFTMTATWVGGGYINGTAEASFRDGLLWTQAPWGYALSLLIGGLFFAYPMRSRNYTTMLDPFHEKYGPKVAALLFLPALVGELFWSSAILVTLGTTFSTFFNLHLDWAIFLSGVVAIFYTYWGGLWSVALTDVLQLLLILLGMALVVPYVVDHVGGYEALWTNYKSQKRSSAFLFPVAGSLGKSTYLWWDYALLLAFGGIPWGVYFQRVLSTPDASRARNLSLMAAVGCAFMAVGPALIGMSGSLVDWTSTPLGAAPQGSQVLPLMMKYFTPSWVYIIGIGAVAAAVMSSVDSSILSVSTMFSWNVYRPLVKSSTDASVLKVGRLSILIFGTVALVMAFKVKSVYVLWTLCSDFVYVLLFPQLILVLYDSKATKEGALVGFALGLILRLGGGEPALGLPSFLPYPMQDPELGMLFPFRTFAMVSSLGAIWAVNRLPVFGQAKVGEEAYSS